MKDTTLTEDRAGCDRAAVYLPTQTAGERWALREKHRQAASVQLGRDCFAEAQASEDPTETAGRVVERTFRLEEFGAGRAQHRDPETALAEVARLEEEARSRGEFVGGDFPGGSVCVTRDPARGWASVSQKDWDADRKAEEAKRADWARTVNARRVFRDAYHGDCERRASFAQREREAVSAAQFEETLRGMGS